MAHLKVTFPHDNERGERLEAGQIIEVADRLVDFYMQPHASLNMVVYALSKHATILNADQTAPAPAKLPAFGDKPSGLGPEGGVFSAAAKKHQPNAPMPVLLDGVSVEAANDTDAVRAANEQMAAMAAASIEAAAVTTPEAELKPSDAEVAATEAKKPAKAKK